MALVPFLQDYLPYGWAWFISQTVFIFVICLILMLVGVSRLKAKNLMPRKTIQQLQEDAALAKRQVNGEERTGHGFQRAA